MSIQHKRTKKCTKRYEYQEHHEKSGIKSDAQNIFLMFMKACCSKTTVRGSQSHFCPLLPLGPIGSVIVSRRCDKCNQGNQDWSKYQKNII